MRFLLLTCCLCFGLGLFAQDYPKLTHTKKFSVNDTILIENESINPFGFTVLQKNGQALDSTLYTTDFPNGRIFIHENLKKQLDSLTITYRKFPRFLTKTYQQFSEEDIIENTDNLSRVYKLNQQQQNTTQPLFDGLNTSGSIARGITTGNNQNTVLDSELDLQITGKISDNVSIRASIQDANVPVQEAGYSQNLNEFDQIFIELIGKNWQVRAGDIDLVNNTSYFASFQKKVQGLSVKANLNSENNPTHAFVAGALVKGVFTRNQFTAQEGNQGPYKLSGPNGELYTLIVSGSERVFVNGQLLKRGENNDYLIDYNAGELIFNATFPITSDMRINIEFQYTERNYSRVIATGGAEHKNEKFSIGAFVYSENDLKNQPLQQNLSDNQKQILAEAGNNPDKMIAPSAVPDAYNENKILYTKQLINGTEVFVYSNNPEDDLYAVRFSYVGEGLGNYKLSDQYTSAISKIYEYIAPENGESQGDYAPVIRLKPPTKLQLAVVNGTYTPNEKTHIGFELAGSKNDENLFSSIDDTNTNGFAGRIKAKQRLFKSKDSLLTMYASAEANIIDEKYKSIERLYDVEFNRNWNLENLLELPKGNQHFITTELALEHQKRGQLRYAFQELGYGQNYNGNKHNITSFYNHKNLQVYANGSYLSSNATTQNTNFLRYHISSIYSLKPVWIGVKTAHENNEKYNKTTQSISSDSHKFSSYEVFSGIGDSTKVFLQAGYKHRINDSLQNMRLQEVSKSHTYYLNSQLIKNTNSKLELFANYRLLKNKDKQKEDEKTLNTRLLYQQFLWNKIINLNTTYETSSGKLAQQEFTYIEVNPGEGKYTWNDYNQNGIQELEEFEISPYPDQAKFIRVLLPNQVYVKTNQTRFSQLLNVNFSQWQNKKGFKKFLSHFHNQTSYLIEKKIAKNGHDFHFNPFSSYENELASNINFRNTLFFNRGKQRYTTSYTYLNSRNKNLLSTGLQEHKINSHVLDFNHKIQESWLISQKTQFNTTENWAANFSNRDYELDAFLANPKISYLLGDNTRFSIFYQYQLQENKKSTKEHLTQHKLGAAFMFANTQKYTFNGEFNYIYNKFDGNALSPVAYQMLQGLQPEKNFTWTLLAQRKLTDFLDLNFSYFGRKSKNSNTIHTGSIQLRAYF